MNAAHADRRRRVRGDGDNAAAFALAAGELEHKVLRILAGADNPIGSSSIQEQLEDVGIRVSEPTVGRLLRQLDRGELTKRISNRGRVLTRRGRRWLTELDEQAERTSQEKELLDSLQPATFDELKDLLIARRAIEREIGRQAAMHATADDLVQLEEFLAGQRHDHVRPGLHHLIVRIGKSRILGVVLNLLTDNSRRSTTLRAILRQENVLYDESFHRNILIAIRNRDPTAAEYAMVAHVDRMLDAVQRFSLEEQRRRVASAPDAYEAGGAR